MSMSFGLNRSELSAVFDYFSGSGGLNSAGIGAAYFTGLEGLVDGESLASFFDGGFSTFRTPFLNPASSLFFQPNFMQFGVGRFGSFSSYFNHPDFSMPTFKPLVLPPFVPYVPPSSMTPMSSSIPSPSAGYEGGTPSSIAMRNPSYDTQGSLTQPYTPPPEATEEKTSPPKKSAESYQPKIAPPPAVPAPARTPAATKKELTPLPPPAPKPPPKAEHKPKPVTPPVKAETASPSPAKPKPAPVAEGPPKPATPPKPAELPKPVDEKAVLEEKRMVALRHLKPIREDFVRRLQEAKSNGDLSRESFEAEYKDVLALHEDLIREVESGQFKTLPDSEGTALLLHHEIKEIENAFQQVSTRQAIAQKASPTKTKPLESTDWPKSEDGFPLPTEDILFKPYPVPKTQYAIDFSLPPDIQQELDKKLPEMIANTEKRLANKNIEEGDEEYDKQFRSRMIEAIGQWAFEKTTPLRVASAKELEKKGKGDASRMPESLSIAEMFKTGKAECSELTNFLYAVCMHAKKNGPESLRAKFHEVDFGFAAIHHLVEQHVALTAKYDGQTDVYDLANPQIFGPLVTIRHSYPNSDREDLALPQYVAQLLSNKTLTAPAKDLSQLYEAARHLAAAKNATVIHEIAKYHYSQAIQAYNNKQSNYTDQIRLAHQLLQEAEKAGGHEFIEKDLKNTRRVIASDARKMKVTI